VLEGIPGDVVTQMYTPAGSPLKNFAMVGPKAAVDNYGFNNLSGAITDGLLGRTLF
jgi:hypothetical protein